MTNPDQQVPTTFGSLSELENSIQQQHEDVNVVSVNTASTEGVAPPVLEPVAPQTVLQTPVAPQEAPKAPVEQREDGKRSSSPELEAQVAKDIEESRKKGDTEELKNVLINAMEAILEKQNKISPVAERVEQVLKNVEFDPNNIDIVTDFGSDPMALHNQLELINATKPNITFPVIALKSGYQADITALNNNEKIEIRNLRGSVLDQTLKVLRIVYGKHTATSIGKISFDRWLEVTAEEDYDTLVYGLFCATFPNATQFSMKCPHCRSAIELPLYPSQLIEVIDKDRAGQYVAQVLEGYKRGAEFLAESLVAKRERIILPKSKTVIELHTPTLRHMLSNISNGDKFNKTFNSEITSLLKYINAVYVPNIEALAAGRHQFLAMEDMHQRLALINSLEAEDMTALRKAISDRMRQYMVRYRIPDFSCPTSTCAKPIKNVSVDLTELIFLGIEGELTA